MRVLNFSLLIAFSFTLSSLHANPVTLILKDGSSHLSDTDTLTSNGYFIVQKGDEAYKIKRTDVAQFSFPKNTSIKPKTKAAPQSHTTQKVSSIHVHAASPLAEQLNTSEAQAQFGQLRDSMLSQYSKNGDTSAAAAKADELFAKLASGEMSEAELIELAQKTLRQVNTQKNSRVRQKNPQFEGAIEQLEQLISK